MSEGEIASHRRRILAEIVQAEKWLKEIQQQCPHANTQRWPRSCAEDSAWVECLSCGAQLEDS